MAGTEDFVQVAADGVGKLIRNISNLIGGKTVYQQVVSRAKSDGTLMDDEATDTTLSAAVAELAIIHQDLATTNLSTLDADLRQIAQNTQAQPWYMVPLPITPWFTGG